MLGHEAQNARCCNFIIYAHGRTIQCSINPACTRICLSVERLLCFNKRALRNKCAIRSNFSNRLELSWW